MYSQRIETIHFIHEWSQGKCFPNKYINKYSVGINIFSSSTIPFQFLLFVKFAEEQKQTMMSAENFIIASWEWVVRVIVEPPDEWNVLATAAQLLSPRQTDNAKTAQSGCCSLFSRARDNLWYYVRRPLSGAGYFHRSIHIYIHTLNVTINW